MQKLVRPALFGLILLAVSAPLTLAQPASSGPNLGENRLYLAFIEDTAIATEQWWEGRVEFADGDSVESTIFRGVAAFQPWIDVEIGGTVGFGSSDLPAGADGSGATDLDLWGKYYLGGGSRAVFSVGGVVTVPTGDESAGLGLEAFGGSAFGAVRYKLKPAILTGTLGIQFNGDGRTFDGVKRDGETAGMVGIGAIVPLSESFSVIGELYYHGKRLEGLKNEAEGLFGMNWRVGGRGTIRAAVGFGLEDGSPDWTATAGYAAQF